VLRHIGAPTPDGSLPSHEAGIPIEWRDAHQRGDASTIELAQLGQLGQQHGHTAVSDKSVRAHAMIQARSSGPPASWSYNGVEPVRLDRRVILAHVRRQAHGKRWWQLTLHGAAPREAHSVAVRHAAFERIAISAPQRGAVTIERAQQRRRDGVQIRTAFGRATR